MLLHSTDTVTVGDGKLVLNSTAVTSTAAELNLLDGVSGLVQADLTKLAALDATAAELNLLDGGTSATATTIVDADRIILNDNGTMKQVAVSDLNTYTSSTIAADDVSVGDAAVTITTSSGDITIDAAANDSDIIFKGTDGGADITALTLDMSAAGLAIFNNSITVGDNLNLTTDSSVINFGADSDTTLTHTDGAGLTLNSTNKLMFNDASQFIQGASATVLDIAATDEIELTATLIEIVGNSTVSGTLGVTGVTTSNAGVVVDNITIDGQEIDVSSGDLTIDVAGDIILDAGGGDIDFNEGGTNVFKIASDSSDIRIKSMVSDKDFKIQGNDGGANVNALSFDMSEAGAATFSSSITSPTNIIISVDTDADDVSGDSATGRLTLGAGEDLNLYHGGTHSYIVNDTGNLVIDTAGDLVFDASGNDFKFFANGTEILNITNSSSDVIIKPLVDAKDIIFQQRDGTEVARIEDNATFNVSVAGKFAYAGTAVTSTAAELNIIDGDTSATSTTLVDADRFVVNDNGTMVQVAASDLVTYVDANSSAASTGKAIAMAIVFG